METNTVDLTKRTKGELEAFTYIHSDGKIQIEADGKIICDVETYYRGKEEAKANAAYICKAVNNHEELLNWCNKLYAVLFTSKLLDHKEMDALQTVIKNAEL